MNTAIFGLRLANSTISSGPASRTNDVICLVNMPQNKQNRPHRPYESGLVVMKMEVSG
jgi:hypothetical protein